MSVLEDPKRVVAVVEQHRNANCIVTVTLPNGDRVEFKAHTPGAAREMAEKHVSALPVPA